MIVYYFFINGLKRGTTSLEKTQEMAHGKTIIQCAISDYDGYLVGDEYE